MSRLKPALAGRCADSLRWPAAVRLQRAEKSKSDPPRAHTDQRAPRHNRAGPRCCGKESHPSARRPQGQTRDVHQRPGRSCAARPTRLFKRRSVDQSGDVPSSENPSTPS